MTGGAIIAEYITPSDVRSQQLTADFFWPDVEKGKKNGNSRGGHAGRKHAVKTEVIDDDDFETDFQEFKKHDDFEDERFDFEEEEDGFDVKPYFSFSSAAASPPKPRLSRMIGNLSLRSILEKDNILHGSNYLDWYRKLKIVLRYERKYHVLEGEPPVEPDDETSEADRIYYENYHEDALDVQCIMLATMSPELQKQHENMSAREIDIHLRELFQESARTERYDISRAFFGTKLQEGSPVGPHVLKMIGYIEILASMGSKMDTHLAVDAILCSLPPSFAPFVMNFNINNMEKSLPDLLTMLKTAERDMKQKVVSNVMLVGMTNKRMSNWKMNPKTKMVKMSSNVGKKPTLKKGQEIPQSDEKETVCFHCDIKGYCKKNCYLFRKKNDGETNTSGIL